MFKYAHGGHIWVRMDAVEHNRGLGHGKEAKLRMTVTSHLCTSEQSTDKRKQGGCLARQSLTIQFGTKDLIYHSWIGLAS